MDHNAVVAILHELPFDDQVIVSKEFAAIQKILADMILNPMAELMFDNDDSNEGSGGAAGMSDDETLASFNNSLFQFRKLLGKLIPPQYDAEAIMMELIHSPEPFEPMEKKPLPDTTTNIELQPDNRTMQPEPSTPAEKIPVQKKKPKQANNNKPSKELQQKPPTTTSGAKSKKSKPAANQSATQQPLKPSKPTPKPTTKSTTVTANDDVAGENRKRNNNANSQLDKSKTSKEEIRKQSLPPQQPPQQPKLHLPQKVSAPSTNAIMPPPSTRKESIFIAGGRKPKQLKQPCTNPTLKLEKFGPCVWQDIAIGQNEFGTQPHLPLPLSTFLHIMNKLK